MNQAELQSGLEALGAKMDKIGAETTGLQGAVADLETALANAGEVSPGVQAAFEAVKVKAQGVDDLVTDAPAGGAGDPPVDPV